MNRLLAIALLLMLTTPAVASASDFAGYWYGFKRFWADMFASQDGVSMVVLGVLVVAIFIITRGNWKK